MIDRPTVRVVNVDDQMVNVLACAFANVGVDVEGFCSLSEFLPKCDSRQPGCLVFALAAGPCQTALLEELRKRDWMHPFILVIEQNAAPTTVEAIRQGAFDVLENPLDPELLIASVNNALARDAFVRSSQKNAGDVARRISDLTSRQREVMQLVVEGRLTKEIAKCLGISTKTVEVHRSNITRRMGTESVAQLVRMITLHAASNHFGVNDGSPSAAIGISFGLTTPTPARLPLQSIKGDRSVGSDILELGHSSARSQATGIRILLVEDEPTDVEFVKRALLRSGDDHPVFDLCWARELSDAFEHLRTSAFDVVLLDLGLPGCTGLESLQNVREINQDIPVVIMTGMGDEKMALEAIDEGAQDYLVKGNLSADMLIRSIRYAIQRQQLQAATKQHQLELEARLTLAAIVESCDDAIESETLDGTIISWNKGAERIFGYSKLEALGQHISILAPLDRVDELQHILQAVRQGQCLQHLETERIHKNGRRLHIALSLSPIKDRNGLIVGISGIAQDITDRIQVRDLLAQQACDLARANSVLERTNRDLKQFTYSASHDLKEPLRMVASYCRLLELEYGDRLDPEASEYLHFATDGAKRMQTLIDDLLSFSSVGMTNAPLELVELRDALDGALLNLEAAILESGVQIEIDSLPAVSGQLASLTVLFQNLIGNAIKFHSECIPTVRVSSSACTEGWEIAVQDNGIGVEPEFRERIFDLFQRLHTRDEYSGTGIGLATCKKIVECHGGRIWTSSQPSPGTKMCFTLPRVAIPDAPIEQVVPA